MALSDYDSTIRSRPILSPEQEREDAIALSSLRLLFWETSLSSSDRAAVIDLAAANIVERSCGADLGSARKSRSVRKIAAVLSTSGVDPGCVEPALTDECSLGLLAEYRRRRARFVECNLRLAISIAYRGPRSSLSVEDRIQEGTIGLLRAVDGFDPYRGFRFSTYAAWWIRHHVYRASTNNRGAVRIPQNILTTHMRISKVRRELRATLGREPHDRDVAAAVGISLEKMARIVAAMATECVAFEDLPHETYEEDYELREHPHATVGRALRSLPPRLREILVERFGIDDRYGMSERQPRTLQALATERKISRERVRQLQNIALGKVRRALRVA